LATDERGLAQAVERTARARTLGPSSATPAALMLNGFNDRAPSPPPNLGLSVPDTNASSNNNNKEILVPTKTGKEPVKKLYPKETTTPELIRGRFVHLAPLVGPPLGPPMQFTAQAFTSHSQPHSLPMFPLGAAPIAWTATGPASLWAAAPPPVSVPMGVPSRARSRDRVGIDSEMRRRAQSKSPVRKPNYLQEISDFSRRFRELGDAVRQRMGRKAAHGTADATDGQVKQLKSNLKKQQELASLGMASAASAAQAQTVSMPAAASGLDASKKVHFNKFATVQMME
jgi:hypothetical protein